jgi:hypothetical protein
MGRITVDTSLERTSVAGFDFPLGVYPVEPLDPKPGYFEQFEAAEGAEPFLAGMDEEWEEWPDRWLFDVLVSATRLPALFRLCLTLLPSRVYPILDVLGNDDYREIDPYLAYDLVGVDHIVEGVRRYGPWLFEDGMVGFGAMSIDPFVYLFVDEHKVLTIRVQLDLKERVEKILRAFDLELVEDIRTADSVHHEHRSILTVPEDDPRIMGPDDILDELRGAWALELNVPGEGNADEDGKELGMTGWRCLVRCIRGEDLPDRFAEVLLTADSLDTAERLATEGAARLDDASETWAAIDPIALDRLNPDHFAEALGEPVGDRMAHAEVCRSRWVEEPGEDQAASPLPDAPDAQP